MKKIKLILAILILFAATIYFAYSQGSIALIVGQESVAHLVSLDISPVIYSGLLATIANVSAGILGYLMMLVGNNILLALIVLALIVELILLYPSVKIQLKQKKIHLFHKKLVDRFRRGELSVSKSKHELNILYAVNEKMHARGAVLVVFQMILLVSVLFGLNLLTNVPSLFAGSWSVLNISFLNKPVSFAIPLTASLLYFLHSLIKIYFKQKEDYIGQTQSNIALALAVISSSIVYYFAGIFAIALTVYFVTLITFSTIRYIIVEQHSKKWGKLAHKELIKNLQTAKIHRNKIELLSRKWNNFPIVRYINFYLLEESLSMSLGLIIALNFLDAMPV